MTDLYDRTAYWLFVMDIPHLRGKELSSAVNIKLKSLFPGDIENYDIQIIKNGSKKGGFLVFILNKDAGKTMLPVSPLFALYLCRQKHANVLFITEDWIELVVIENGAVSSSTVKNRNDETLASDFTAFCGGRENINVYCGKDDMQTLRALCENNDIRFFDGDAELKKTDVHKISLFKEKSPVVKTKRFLLSAFVLFLAVFVSASFYNHNKNEKEKLSRQRLEQDRAREERIERQRETQTLLELRTVYREIINAKTASPFEIAAVIAECAPSRTRIQYATFNRNSFQIEGVTDNPLLLLGNFENHAMVKNARLHHARPFAGGGEFSLNGEIFYAAREPEESLSANEQIAFFQNIIALETNASNEERFTPAGFGLAASSLFSKWNCSIISYRYMNEPGKIEIELSLRGSSGGFFNALHDINTNYRSWDAHLTQIRNLYPRNLLDVIIRIRTGNIDDTDSNNQHDYIENASVANITRNYFQGRLAANPTTLSTSPQTAVAPPPQNISTESVSWLEYVGTIYDEENGRSVYVKDTRSGRILRLRRQDEGDMRYMITTSGSVIAYINEHVYEIQRRQPW